MRSPIFLLCSLIMIAFDISSQSTNKNIFGIYKYRNVGPTRGGRVTTVAGTESLPGTFYLGATGGGVWKTEDFGINWKNVSDGYFETASIGAIRVDPRNSNVIYVGTGSDGIRSNVISGKGVYKSSDAGESWRHIGLREVGQIGAVEINPSNPEIIYIAAQGQAFQANSERGVYRSKDGGTNWELVLFHSDTVGAADLELMPGNPDVIYAALWRNERKPWTIISGAYQQGGIYKSTNGGDSWEKLSTGLPQGLIGKIDLAVSAAKPERLYALVEAPEGERGLYRSDDAGASFQLVSDKKELTARPFYYTNVDADPNNADIVYVNEEGFYKSVDAGKSWTSIRSPHGDNHDMWINPSDSDIFIQSNDGGANVTLNGGKSWSSQENQATAELYQVAVDDQYPYWLYAGQQDNSTIAVPSMPPYDAVGGGQTHWMAVGGCETGPAVPKPGNSDIVYSNCKGRFGVYNKKTGQEQQYYVGAANIYSHKPTELAYRFQRVAPIHVSIHAPHAVYHGSQYLHKTLDDGKTWETISGDLTAFELQYQVNSGTPITRDITGEEYYSTIYEINESPLKKGMLWVGSNDGPVHVSSDDGKNWQNVTPQIVAPGGRVDCIEASPHRVGKAYAAILRYQLGDWRPYLVRTNDAGKSWTLITQGIPEDSPVRTVREDPEREGLLFAGTEYGMYVSFNDGENWQAFQQNLPVTPITDIKIFRNDLILSTMGRSFWIMDDLSSLRQLADNATQEIQLYKPSDVYLYPYTGSRGTSVPEYPSAGVNIDYRLSTDLRDNLRLELLNSSGNIIRSFESKEDKEQSSENRDMATGFVNRIRSAKLNSTAGAHRFRWDIRHTGPWDARESRNGQDGAYLSPGKYQVRLIAGDDVFEQEFSVLIDPRIAAAGININDLKAQEELLLKIQELQSNSRRLAEKIKNRNKEIDDKLKDYDKKSKKEQKKINPDALKAEKETLNTISQELVTEEGRYMTPMLIDQLNYLHSMLNSTPQRPGRDAYERYEELKRKLDDLLESTEK